MWLSLWGDSVVLGLETERGKKEWREKKGGTRESSQPQPQSTSLSYSVFFPPFFLSSPTDFC